MAWWDRVDWSDPIERDCPLNQGLVGWWMGAPNCYGGTRLQDLCNKNHGTLTNMNPATDWVGTEYGPGLHFDGSTDQWVDITGIPRLTVGSIDIAFSAGSTANAALFSYGNAVTLGTVDIWWVRILNGKLQVFDRTIDRSGTGSITVSADTPHVVTVSAAGRGSGWKLFVDGVQDTVTPNVASSVGGFYGSVSTATPGSQIARILRGASQIGLLNGSIESVGIRDNTTDATMAASIFAEHQSGFPDALRWLRGRSMVSVPAGVPATGNRRRRALICGRAA